MRTYGVKGGDFDGYLRNFRNEDLTTLKAMLAALPKYGAGWKRSNYRRALEQAIQEKENDVNRDD